MKVSLDRKTIVELPAGMRLMQYLLMEINAQRIISDCFTAYDLAQGDSKELIVQIKARRYKSVRVWAGHNLTEADLAAQYDDNGSIIKTEIK